MTHDTKQVMFLQAHLPQLALCWEGFRKVRVQVIKKVQRRIEELGLPDWEEYGCYLRSCPDELAELDKCCRITISRFYRDRQVFDYISQQLLAAIAERASGECRIWSVGCASGEELYTLVMIWKHWVSPLVPSRPVFSGTDINPEMIERAKKAAYPASALRDLPPEWREEHFVLKDGVYSLNEDCKAQCFFAVQDIRHDRLAGPWDLICCRNLAFTYFSESLQEIVLQRLVERLRPGGVLVTGRKERLPACPQIEPVCADLGIYRRQQDSFQP